MKKHLNLTNTLVNFDSNFKQTLFEILPKINSNPKVISSNNIFDQNIEDFIQKYGSNNLSSIDDLLSSSTQIPYFKDDSSSNITDTIESLLPK